VRSRVRKLPTTMMQPRELPMIIYIKLRHILKMRRIALPIFNVHMHGLLLLSDPGFALHNPSLRSHTARVCHHHAQPSRTHCFRAGRARARGPVRGDVHPTITTAHQDIFDAHVFVAARERGCNAPIMVVEDDVRFTSRLTRSVAASIDEFIATHPGVDVYNLGPVVTLAAPTGGLIAHPRAFRYCDAHAAVYSAAQRARILQRGVMPREPCTEKFLFAGARRKHFYRELLAYQSTRSVDTASFGDYAAHDQIVMRLLTKLTKSEKDGRLHQELVHTLGVHLGGTACAAAMVAALGLVGKQAGN
jgi:hypothetical protein